MLEGLTFGIQEAAALLMLGGVVGGFLGTLALQLRKGGKNGHTIEALARVVADLTERLDAAEIVAATPSSTVTVKPIPTAPPALATHELPPRDPLVTGRPCFCPEDRWTRWRDGVIAGTDHVVGTEDDLKT